MTRIADLLLKSNVLTLSLRANERGSDRQVRNVFLKCAAGLSADSREIDLIVFNFC
jgi:hypothetical protein